MVLTFRGFKVLTRGRDNGETVTESWRTLHDELDVRVLEPSENSFFRMLSSRSPR